MEPILVTGCLAEREMGMADLAFVTAMLTDPEVMRFWPRPYTPPEFEEWIARHRGRYASDGCGYWLLCTREGGTRVGQAGILMTDIDGVREAALGYILDRSQWHRG